MFSFQGVVGRKQFVISSLLNIVISIIAIVICVSIVAMNDSSPSGSGVPNTLWIALIAIVGISGWIASALVVKRARDAGLGKFWVVLTIAGFFVATIAWAVGMGKLAMAPTAGHSFDPDVFGGESNIEPARAVNSAQSFDHAAQPAAGNLSDMSDSDLVARAEALRQAEAVATPRSSAPNQPAKQASQGFGRRKGPAKFA